MGAVQSEFAFAAASALPPVAAPAASIEIPAEPRPKLVPATAVPAEVLLCVTDCAAAAFARNTIARTAPACRAMGISSQIAPPQ
jgi:hypothetical protein